jgi:hypothetical protein
MVSLQSVSYQNKVSNESQTTARILRKGIIFGHFVFNEVGVILKESMRFDPRVTALARPRSNGTSKLQTRPLVREGVTE